MKIYALHRNDGGVSIMRITAEGLALGATVESEIAKWPAEHAQAVVGHQEIAEADIPADRTFRDAWKQDLTVDMPKARQLLEARLGAKADKAKLAAAKTPDELKALTE